MAVAVDTGHQDMVSSVLVDQMLAYVKNILLDFNCHGTNSLSLRLALQVHDVQLDYYGRRLATCSSDATVKLFNVVGEQIVPVAGKIRLRNTLPSL